MLHALFNGTVLLGLYSNYEKCNIMMTGLINHKLAIKEKLIIKSFIENSITESIYEEPKASEDNTEYEINTDVFTTESVKETKQKPIELSPESKKKKEEEIKEKMDIQNSLFELKKKKEKLEESKRVYNVDIDLYNKFKNIKKSNPDFEIPEMFEHKYNLMYELESNNNLSWETFYENYTPPQMNTSYSKLFE